jgi:hypothetical protein
MDTEPKPTGPDLDKVELILPPKKKRVKKRFTSKEQIVKQIDKFTKKAKTQRDKQSKAYALANNIRRDAQRTSDPTLLATAGRQDEIGDRWGRKADRLEREVLKVLSAKLAEFQTDTIPGITDDRSVPGI